MTQLTEALPTDDAAQLDWVVVQNVVFPNEDDSIVWPLYVDWGAMSTSGAQPDEIRTDARIAAAVRAAVVRATPRPQRRLHDHDRLRGRVPAHERISFATYFNAFPAAYWQEHSGAHEVRLTVEVSGDATLDVYRSNARGNFVRIAGVRHASGSHSFTLPLNRYGDGGWLWFEVEAGEESVAFEGGTWSVPRSSQRQRGKATVGIATFNLTGACVLQLERFAAHPNVLERVARIVIVDQGTDHVVDAPGYQAVAARLGDKLRVIEQPNLGGSGGFARGMLEAFEDPASDHVLFLDDDAEAEPESVLRAIAFADCALKPLIVGGHMFNANERTILHSMGEKVNRVSFWWESVDPALREVDLAQQRLRAEAALNRRIDVDYNGWWMCLIPRSVYESIGFPLPYFIKWDDAEYGLRAASHGIPSVSLPGVAAWHVPWYEKDDGLDWQAYFHQRNRMVTALLHSPFRRGGHLVRKSFASDLKHLFSMQYTASELRRRALEDVLAGPAHMNGSLESSAQEARQAAVGKPDGSLITNRADFPEVRHPGRIGRPPRSAVAFAAKALAAGFGQLWPERTGSAKSPQTRVRSAEAKWWRLAVVDSALVSNAAGAGVWFYRRNRKEFVRLFTRSVGLHAALYLRWPSLAKEYRRAAPRLWSADAWRRTFGDKKR